MGWDTRRDQELSELRKIHRTENNPHRPRCRSCVTLEPMNIVGASSIEISRWINSTFDDAVRPRPQSVTITSEPAGPIVGHVVFTPTDSRLSDDDVQRIAKRVAELLKEAR